MIPEFTPSYTPIPKYLLNGFHWTSKHLYYTKET